MNHIFPVQNSFIRGLDKANATDARRNEEREHRRTDSRRVNSRTTYAVVDATAPSAPMYAVAKTSSRLNIGSRDLVFAGK